MLKNHISVHLIAAEFDEKSVMKNTIMLFIILNSREYFVRECDEICNSELLATDGGFITAFYNYLGELFLGKLAENRSERVRQSLSALLK